MSWIPSYKKKLPPPEPYVPCSWANGTDEEIVEALEKHYAGEVDLTEYWSVGDERTVTLGSIPNDLSGDDFEARTHTMVILNAGGKTLTTPINGHTECAFIIGMKNCWMRRLYVINNASTDSWWGAAGWWGDGTLAKQWCSNTLYNNMPTLYKSILKQFKNESLYNGEIQLYDEYMSLLSVTEVVGVLQYRITEGNQFEYYKTASNRIKTRGDGGSKYPYITRHTEDGSNYHYIDSKVNSFGGWGGTVKANSSDNSVFYVSPFGVI